MKIVQCGQYFLDGDVESWTTLPKFRENPTKLNRQSQSKASNVGGFMVMVGRSLEIRQIQISLFL